MRESGRLNTGSLPFSPQPDSRTSESCLSLIQLGTVPKLRLLKDRSIDTNEGRPAMPGNWPENPLLDRLRYQSFCRVEMEGGIPPESRLELRERRASDFSPAMLAGSFPESWLWSSERSCRFCRVNRDSGSWPVKRLYERSRKVRFRNAVGIWPEMKLWLRSIDCRIGRRDDFGTRTAPVREFRANPSSWRLGRSQMDGGIEPLRRFPARETDARRVSRPMLGGMAPASEESSMIN
ncbi:unnamed protein product [Linum tenue]|uniref:Uncharacterized protein n=1 Tax=Linum tenue TaxID=586396 RepID=A0AAV0K0X5_9ROSI|nr:unnamed protein product [Linum tenue]